VLKAPPDADISSVLARVDSQVHPAEGVMRAIDVDPAGML
jgi:hypothetical protein